jgi:hypothetical protein
MAKRLAPAKEAASKKTARGKVAKKKTSRRRPPPPEKVSLGSKEKQAIALAQSSEALCQELELAVTSAMIGAVREVYRRHDLSLGGAAAQNVALVLFGD